MEGCVKFLEGKLKLKVNREKSAVGSPLELNFLGFGLYRGKEGVRTRVHEKPLERLVERLKALASRKRSGTPESPVFCEAKNAPKFKNRAHELIVQEY
jgi:hypothetical protein